MKEAIKIISVLTGVCVICAFLLAFVYKSANKKIQENAQAKVKTAITNLVPEAVKVSEEKIGEEVVYKLFDKNQTLIGYAFGANGQGYQGKISMLVATGTTLDSLKGIEVIDSLETPGLGAKINENSFKDQFKGLGISEAIKLTKESASEGQVQAITGATVSSRAVVNILNAKITLIKEALGK